MEDSLRDVYKKIGGAGAFSGPHKIQEALKAKGIDLSIYKIKRWLQSEDSYSLFRPYRKPQTYPRIVVSGMNRMWDSDLMDMQSLTKHNDGVKYLMVCIDVFSRFLRVRALKDKKAGSCTEALESILLDGSIPKLLRTDKGQEFKNHRMKDLYKQYNIHHYTTQNTESKANYSERSIRTLKNLIFRYLEFNNSNRYIDKLQLFVDTYNNNVHSSLGIAPAQVNESNEAGLSWSIYWPKKESEHIKKRSTPLKKEKRLNKQKSALRYKFKIGQTVRILAIKGFFFKESARTMWSGELFKVKSRFRRQGLETYKLTDLDGLETITGTFSTHELQKVDVAPDKVYKIEKILKVRKVNGKKQYYIKWADYGKAYQSWINEEDMEK